MTRDIRLEASTALVMRKARRARTDPAAFIEFVWANSSDFRLADFHHAALEVLADERNKFVYWEAARGHAKSLIVGALVCWWVGLNPNHKVKLVCANDKEARKRLYEVKQNIEKNPMLRLTFPDLRRDDSGDWNKSRMIVKREQRLPDWAAVRDRLRMLPASPVDQHMSVSTIDAPRFWLLAAALAVACLAILGAFWLGGVG